MAAPYEGSPAENSLNGRNKNSARREVNILISKSNQTFYHDSTWSGVEEVWDKLKRAGIDFTMMKSDYTKNDRGEPDGKTWTFQVNFINDKGRPDTIYGIVRASFAGSTKDVSEKYDIVADAS